jgi:prepilin-type N-terminal cleavage/methylation domain-containing protein
VKIDSRESRLALPCRRAAGRDGLALLEVVIALAVLSMVALGAMTLSAQSADAVRRARTADGEMRAMSAYLDVISLWPREDLDRHLGERSQGAWMLRVNRVAPTLYEVALRDSAAAMPALSTVLYRSRSRRATP